MNSSHLSSGTDFTFCLKLRHVLGKAIDPLKPPSFEGFFSVSLGLRLL